MARSKDEPELDMSDEEVIDFIEQCYGEARDAKQERLARNQLNTEAAMGRQDWSHKQAGMSREFLPKTGVAVEQLVAFFKRGLTKAGDDWFEFVPPKGPDAPLNAREMRLLLRDFLEECLLEDNVVGQATTAIADGLKLGALESLCIFKVHGQMQMKMVLDPRSGPRRSPDWMLRIDVVPFEAFFEDPTGKRLYRIHLTERDLWEVQQLGEEGVYDKEMVDKLVETQRISNDQERRTADKRGMSESDPPGHRVKVVVKEFWGTILKKDGSIGMQNCLAAVANERFLIRKPQVNPLWHGSDPFVVFPLLRVPLSAHHRAVFDDAAQLNLAMNELFNLFVDGALASVWGVRQVRPDYLSDPADIEDGIPQGMTLAVSTTLPPGEKVLETVTTGQVPSEALAVYEALVAEFAGAALTNELKLGQLPGRTVKATEIVELQQSQAGMLDSLVTDAESGIAELLKKAWLTVLQHIGLVEMQRIVGAIGAEAADRLASEVNPARRFAAVAQASRVKVRGLSTMLSKVRDFQKMAALMQLVSTNPVLMQQFFARYDAGALLAYMMKTLQLDPDEFLRAEQEEPRTAQQDMQTLPMFQQMVGGAPGSATGAPNGGLGGPGTGGAPIPAEVNQMVNPMTGMTGNQ